MQTTLLDVNGEPLDPIWAAEFRGYFFGDGFLGIVRNGRGRTANSLPAMTSRAQITTRDDDIDMLHDIAAKMGGRVYGDDFLRAQESRRPVAIWRTRSTADVLRVCDVLDAGVMPSKKRKEVEIVRRFLAIRVPPGKRNPNVDYVAIAAQREACLLEIQKLHSYQPSI